MPSNNRLLGSTRLEVKEEVRESVSTRVPVWRYHESCLKGIVVKTEKELNRLDKEGWVDHPGKIALLPGHEKLFEGDVSKNDISVELNTEMKEEEVQEVLAKLTSKKKDKDK
jgi:hypothetical protein